MISGDLASPQPRWRPVSAGRLAGYYLADLTRSALRLVRSRVRTRDRVEAEYHGGVWRSLLHERPWVGTRSLRDFLVGGDRRSRLAKIDGRVVEIATDDYYRLRLERLREMLAQHDDGTELVELGCGFGFNLFSLLLARRSQRLLGFDISENAITAARDIAEHFGIADRVCFGTIDVTAPTDPNLRQIRGKTVFTCCCIEQVPQSVEQVVANILEHRPARVIHIEPATELLQLWRPLDLLNYAYVRSMDYQARLLTTLRTLAAQGRIELMTQERLPWAPTIHNDMLVALWRPTSSMVAGAGNGQELSKSAPR